MANVHSSSSSVPTRFFQRIINAATSRIYSPGTVGGSKEREILEEGAESFANGTNCIGANDVANGEAEMIPSVPGTSESNQQLATAKSSTSRSSASGGVASSDMELDENFADL